MTIPNAGPEHPDLNDPGALDAARRGNPALALRGDRPTDDVRAATTRAGTVSHRFGSARHSLSRPARPGSGAGDPRTEEDGETDPRD